MNQIALVDPNAPRPLHPQWDAKLRFWLTKLDPPATGSRIAAVDAPDEAQRAAMVRHVADLTGWLRPGTVPEMQTWIVAVLSNRASEGENEEDFRLVVGVYLRTLGDLPGFALRAACRAVLRGEVKGQNLHYRPSAAEIRVEAQRQQYTLAKEMREIELVLGATVIGSKSGPAKRAAVVADQREIIASIQAEGIRAEQMRTGRIVDAEPPAPPETPQQTLDRVKGEAPPPFLPTLKRALGIPNRPVREPDWRDDERRTGS